jgi:hypothetical protein
MKINRCSGFLLIVLCFCIKAHSQLTDLARLEYSFIPQSESEDQYTRLRGLINFPIKLKKSTYLVVGAEFNNIILNLEEDYPFDIDRLDNIFVIDLNLAYTFKWNPKWRAGFKFNPRIASTLTQNVSKDDIFLNGGVFAIRDKTKDKTIKHPFRLIVGLTYNATTGVPFPLPFISYFRRINEKWTYNAGVPKSNIKYALTKKDLLQTFVGLDGYLANIQDPIEIRGQLANEISLSVIVGGLGYEHLFTKHLVGYLFSGYTFRLNNVLRNNDRDEVFKLDDVNAFYLRTGIKFKI